MNKDKSKNIEVIRSINIEPKPKKILAEIYSRVSSFFVDKILKEKTRRQELIWKIQDYLPQKVRH